MTRSHHSCPEIASWPCTCVEIKFRAPHAIDATRPPRRFLAQVQGQLALSGHAWCDLAIWIPSHLAVFRVPRDAYYWDAVLKPGLVAFSEELRQRRHVM